MLFDLFVGGHHGQYIEQLAQYWVRRDLPGWLDIVVTPNFARQHPRILQLAEERSTVRLVPVKEPVPLQPAGMRAQLHSVRVHGQLLRRYVTRLRPQHCLLMYFDHLQLPLALGLKFSFPVRLSGIYFRPSFHYHLFRGGPVTLRDRATQLRKRLLLSEAIRNRHFSHLFCLDPYVVPRVQAPRRDVRVLALPDGVEPAPALRSRAETRGAWGVDNHRRVALFFGSIAERKGIYPTLAALRLLPAGQQQALSLVVIGAARGAEKSRIDDQVSRLRGQGRVQIIQHDRFVDEEEIPGIFAAADLVLLPYQRHVGSSGVLVRAALAGIPVLGSDYGLLGEHVRRHGLGRTVDAASPKALAKALERWLLEPASFPFDAKRATCFAAQNTAAGFAETLLYHLGAESAPA